MPARVLEPFHEIVEIEIHILHLFDFGIEAFANHRVCSCGIHLGIGVELGLGLWLQLRLPTFWTEIPNSGQRTLPAEWETRNPKPKNLNPIP